MCLLIVHPANTDFSDEDIADFYKHNQDGMGVMYAEDGVLYTNKVLPRNADEAIAFYREHIKGRDCAVHFRMQTHGLIDMENCHPYWVFEDGYPIALMHNGILSTGNAADKTKSDTWHYIRDYIRPIIHHKPELFYDPALMSMMEAHIGDSNKFVMLDAYGNMSVINEHAFVDYQGAKLSNTYAWTASRGGYGTKWGNSFASSAWKKYTPGASLPGSPGFADYPDDEDYANLTLDYASEEWVDLLFDTLCDTHPSVTKQLSYAAAEKYYNAVGDDAAWSLVACIENGMYSDTDVMDIITNISEATECPQH